MTGITLYQHSGYRGQIRMNAFDNGVQNICAHTHPLVIAFAIVSYMYARYPLKGNRIQHIAFCPYGNIATKPVIQWQTTI